MSDFRIKVNVEIDKSKAESQLKALSEEQNVKLKVGKLDLSSINRQIDGVKKKFQDAFKINSKVKKDLKEIEKSLKMIGDIQKRPTPEIGKGQSVKHLDDRIKKYKEIANIIDKLNKQTSKGIMDDSSLDRTKGKIDELTKQMKSLYNSMNESQKAKIEDFNINRSRKQMVEMNKSMTDLKAKANSLSTYLNNMSFSKIDTSVLDKVKNEIKSVQNLIDNDVNFDIDIGEATRKIKEVESEIKSLKNLNENLIKIEGVEGEFNKIKTYANEAKVEIKELESSMETLKGSVGNIDFSSNMKNFNSELKNTKNEINSIAKQSKGGLLKNILGTKDDFFGNFAQFKVAEVGAEAIISSIRGMGKVIVETDKAMTDLGKVAPEGFATTSKQIVEFSKIASETAKQTGKTNIEVIEGVTKAFQSGIKNQQDAVKFSKGSAIFANVGDMEQGQADSYLASIMSSYGGVENSLKPLREQIKGAGKDYNTLTKFIDLANHAGEFIA